jgi:hypothetical protein
MTPRLPGSPDLGARVDAILDLLWTAMDRPASRAIHHLRLALPRQRDELEAAYPRTAAAIAHWDAAWTETVERAFDGLDVDPVKLARVRSLLPGAMRGLHSEQFLSTYTDSDEARAGLAGALVAYLS